MRRSRKSSIVRSLSDPEPNDHRQAYTRGEKSLCTCSIERLKKLEGRLVILFTSQEQSSVLTMFGLCLDWNDRYFARVLRYLILR